MKQKGNGGGGDWMLKAQLSDGVLELSLREPWTFKAQPDLEYSEVAIWRPFTWRSLQVTYVFRCLA